jgi:bacterioferritin-associated ferredoxin
MRTVIFYPAEMAGRQRELIMIVCVCNGVSDRDVKAAIKNGMTSVEALSANLGVASGCGCCRETCADMIAEHACSGSCASFLGAFPVFTLTPIAA